MARNLPAHQAEAIVQLHNIRIVSNLRHSKPSNSSSETPAQRNEYNQAIILKDTNNNSNTASNIYDLNIPNELLDSTEGQKLENC